MRHMAMAAALAAMLAACAEPPPPPDTVVCAKFKFRAADRADIVRARQAFFAASILIRRPFSDDSHTSTGKELAPWSTTHAEIAFHYRGRPRIVLGGHSDYPKGNDPASDMRVYAFAETDPAMATACEGYLKTSYEQVRDSLARQWPIEEEMPYRIGAGKPLKSAAPTPR